ncbi:MAG: PQQ-dependent sugar dehydrogenase [Bacteroidota bacterium]
MMKVNTPKEIVLFLILIVGIIGCSTPASEKGEDKEKKDVYVRSELSWQHGMELFNMYCASCHNFSSSGIGPNLAGVTSRMDKDWLIKFINNPQAVIESGDEHATQQFEKYQQYMPPFPMIQGEDMEDLLSFINRFSQGEKQNQKNRPGGIINPVEAKIPYSNLTLDLEEQFIVPASAENPPLARINKMSAINGGRVFLHDLNGKLYEVVNKTELREYLDLSAEFENFIHSPGLGSGFGSWAFHPDFEKNGLFYTTHTEKKNSAPADYSVPDSIGVALQGVLVEWKADDPKAGKFTGSHRELMRVDMVSVIHTLQELSFNPLSKPGSSDYGMLYMGIGDAGSALKGYLFLCDNYGVIWAKVLRIDPLGNNSKNGKYGFPADNPFVNTPGALGEIWASGFRNPHRISWDVTGSGKMFITTIGQHSLEEVNQGEAGGNYGWPYREGTFLFDTEANPEIVYPLPDNDTGYLYPVAQYDHDEGNAISGGFVYFGKKIPELKGKYIFGDIVRGTLFYAEVAEMEQGRQAPVYRLNVSIDGKPTDMETITRDKRVDLRIGTDADGEMYILSKANGGVYKIVACKEAPVQ